MYESNILDGPPTATEAHPVTGEKLPVGVGHECVVRLVCQERLFSP